MNQSTAQHETDPTDSTPAKASADEFRRQAAAPPPSWLAEFTEFLRTNRKWWLAPIVIVLLLLSGLILLTQTAVGPFIYILF